MDEKASFRKKRGDATEDWADKQFLVKKKKKKKVDKIIKKPLQQFNSHM